MWWRLACGVVTGACTSNYVSCKSVFGATADPPKLDAVLDPSKDVKPLSCVVIGGGLSGTKTAYQLDSIFDVTLIDSKNYAEITSDIIPIIATPWSEKNEEACRKLHYLHRYYLKRANVLTGQAKDVTEEKVILDDGREVNYDVLVLATGEEKSFPFASKQRTIAGRVEELKQFNTFLGTTKKVAIVGGGPMGVSLCAELAEARPELSIDFFHSHAEVLPESPPLAREYAFNHLAKLKNVQVHLCSRVLDVEASNAEAMQVTAHRIGWMAKLLGKQQPEAPIVIPESYALTVERLKYEPVPPQSIVSQIYFGRLKPTTRSTVESIDKVEGYDYVFSLAGETPRPVPSAFLEPHVTADGHMRCSTLLQLYGYPHIFAIGRCNNLPWVRCIGSSDMQTRTLFRMMNTIINSPQRKFLHTQDGVQLSRMTVPRLMVRLGTTDACGSTPWSGGLTGMNAFREFIQDRAHVMKEYSQPIFYKQQDPKRVQSRISEWKENEITDITDFSHTS